MDLWESGVAPAKITDQLGVPVQRVRGIISTYRISSHDHFERAARLSTDALLAAIRRAHPEMIGG